jgi:hypothetical protein
MCRKETAMQHYTFKGCGSLSFMLLKDDEAAIASAAMMALARNGHMLVEAGDGRVVFDTRNLGKDASANRDEE